MTLTELLASPVGTTHIFSEPNIYATNPLMAFKAIHWEKTGVGVRPRMFFAETEFEALVKAEVYDRKRKELRKKWRNSAKQHRETLKR